MGYSPTQVNPRTNKRTNYQYLTPQVLSLPDGEYSLENITEDYTKIGGDSPIFYLFNSNSKFTGYWMYLEIFDKNDQPIKVDLTQIYSLEAIGGVNSVTTKKKQKATISRFHQLTTAYSTKLDEIVSIDSYPKYDPSQLSQVKTSGQIVSQDNNQPIKGAIIEKTD